MEQIILPSKIEIQKGKNPNEETVIVEPCYYGYGTTLGNALRRVLLSSLPGAAVTAVKIKGAQHEFSAVPHVKEDLIEIILNLKQLRLKVFTDEVVRLFLKAKGEREVKAKDIEKDANVQIANPDLRLATLTSKDADLEMEIFVSRGRGYVPTEAREEEKLEIGTIAVDAIFTPIRNVGVKVEPVRVGRITNYDKLILDIETDGTITPFEALTQSVQILIDHFNLIKDRLSGKPAKEAKETEAAEIKKEETVLEEAKEEVKKEEAKEIKKKRGRPKKS
jgi:DNA-directed RNA polymerase subunit alpha